MITLGEYIEGAREGGERVCILGIDGRRVNRKVVIMIIMVINNNYCANQLRTFAVLWINVHACT